MKLLQTKDYLLLIDEEAKVKEDMYVIYNNEVRRTTIPSRMREPKKLLIHVEYRHIVHTNQPKIIAYYPLNSKVKELDLPLLPEHDIEGFRIIQSKQFNSDDMILFAEYVGNYYADIHKPVIPTEKLLNNFIQSLFTQQLPKEFKPIMVCGRCLKPDDNDEDCWSAKECSRNTDFPDTFKTITNSKGKEILVGTYKY